jgi:rhodanese-related sulfurtransferase
VRPPPRGLVALLFLPAALLAAPARAGHAPAAYFPTLRSDAVKRLVDIGEPVVFVDLRRPGEYGAGHLPGALSVPITELERRYREIPAKGRVVLYCDCPLEEMGSVFKFLWTLGYRNHVGLEDGFSGWYRRQYPVVK